MKKGIIIYMICLLVISLNAKIFIREYTYQASEADSKITSRAIALEQVKRLLLEEIGVYIYATVLNGEIETSGEVKELTSIKIEIISAGITKTKIIEENWNGETYYIKAEIEADENDVIKRLDNVIEDKEKTKQLEDSRRRTDNALSEIERLKQQLTQTQDENEKMIIQNEYNESSNQLTAEDWFQKGYNSFEIEEYDKAIECFQKAIEIHPDFAEAYYNMGTVYHYKGNYDRAIECYHKALEINPNHAKAFNNMGSSYYYKINYDKAIECYHKAIEINPDYADAYYNMGIVYGKKRNNDKAIECYQKAIEINPNYVKAYYYMGLSYILKGNYDKGIECLQQAAKLGHKSAQDFLRKKGISW